MIFYALRKAAEKKKLEATPSRNGRETYGSSWGPAMGGPKCS
jgi:hypothetical protein